MHSPPQGESFPLPLPKVRYLVVCVSESLEYPEYLV